MQGSAAGTIGDSMRLKKNFVVVSVSVAGSVRNNKGAVGNNNLFGTAIINLAKGDLVISFNCKMQ